MAREDILDIAGGRFTVGLSSVIGLTVSSGINASIIKYISGGSLEIGGASLTWGQGYLVSTGEAVSFNRSCTVYAVATGATVVGTFFNGLTTPQL